MVHVGKGKPLQFSVLRFSQFRAESLSGSCRKVSIQHSKGQCNQCAARHGGAFFQDIAFVPVWNADINNIRHEYGNHEFKNGFHCDTENASCQFPAVIVKISCQSFQQNIPPQCCLHDRLFLNGFHFNQSEDMPLII